MFQKIILQVQKNNIFISIVIIYEFILQTTLVKFVIEKKFKQFA